MRKLPRNPGLNDDGDTFSCVTRQIESVQSVYLEVNENRLYIDVLDCGAKEVTAVLHKTDAERLLAGLQRLVSTMQ